MDQGTEIQGSFVFDGLRFNAGYRCGFPREHQGGYDKCLKIYNGPQYLSAHEYFGDDKFKVNRVEECAGGLMIHLDFGLYKHNRLQEALAHNTLMKVVILEVPRTELFDEDSPAPHFPDRDTIPFPSDDAETLRLWGHQIWGDKFLGPIPLNTLGGSLYGPEEKVVRLKEIFKELSEILEKEYPTKSPNPDEA
jgi:hypothetical protein